MPAEEFFLQPMGPGGVGLSCEGEHAFVRWESLYQTSPEDLGRVLRAVSELENDGIRFCELSPDGHDPQVLLIRTKDTRWAGPDGLARKVCDAVQSVLGTRFVLKLGGAD